ncbi:hypothetical protein IJ103_04215 [Candidatus Saccharibacteria bacterium]|nr:hypothetical protein [Candidatus Saccharibacteria bacterium]
MKSTKIIAGLGVAAALGVAALPVATFATTNTHTTTVNATIADSLTITINDVPAEAGASTSDTINFNGVVAGTAYENAGSTKIEVATNIPTGYTLSAVSPTALSYSGQEATFAAAATPFTISEGASNRATTSEWGIHVAKTGSGTTLSGTSYKDLTAGQYVAVAGEIDAVSGLNADVDNTYTISYGLNAKTGMPSGDYAGSIQYTVTSAYNAGS